MNTVCKKTLIVIKYIRFYIIEFKSVCFLMLKMSWLQRAKFAPLKNKLT